LGSPFSPAEYVDYGEESQQRYQVGPGEERTSQDAAASYLTPAQDRSYQSQPLIGEERSQAYQPPQEQALDDDSRYESRYEKEEPDYYYEYEQDNLSSIPGEPDIDFPILGVIPRTAFSCADKQPGFYGDTEARCQVWHYCKTDGLKDSFLCPNGTIYTQEHRVCEWWFNVKCEDNDLYARVNEDLYIIPEPNIQRYQEVEQRMYRQQQEQQQQQQQQQSEEYRPPVFQQ